MNVLTTFKLNPDLDLMSEGDWQIDSHLQVNTTYIKKVINPYDESSLELGLKLSDKAREFDLCIGLKALTVDDNENKIQLQKLYALGYQSVTRIDVDAVCTSNTKVASLIAKHVLDNQHDLVLMGIQGSIDNSMQVPYLVSEMTNFACLCDVNHIELIDENTVRVTSEIDGDTLTTLAKLPLVIVIGNASSAYLRVPTLKDKMLTKDKQVIVEHVDVLEKQMTTVLALEKQVSCKVCDFIDGDDDYQKVFNLYHNYLKEGL